MRKYIGVLAVVFTVLVLLPGCGKKNSTDSIISDYEATVEVALEELMDTGTVSEKTSKDLEQLAISYQEALEEMSPVQQLAFIASFSQASARLAQAQSGALFNGAREQIEENEDSINEALEEAGRALSEMNGKPE